MKWKISNLVLVMVMAAMLPFTTLADKPIKFTSEGVEVGWADSRCPKIQDGTIYRSDGTLVTVGYDEWGYNYQAHMYNGMYCDYHPIYRPGGTYHDWCIEYYGNVELIMKWSDEWLANTDCDLDGALDRHYGYPSYRGSGAWTTNHMGGSYELDGKTCQWEYFVKIVAAPADAELIEGIWYNVDGIEIGPVIWTDFATVQEVENDPCFGLHGVQFLSPDHPGLGGW